MPPDETYINNALEEPVKRVTHGDTTTEYFEADDLEKRLDILYKSDNRTAARGKSRRRYMKFKTGLF